MEKRALEQLETAIDAIDRELAGRVEKLARKSTAGQLTSEERAEYTAIVELNDTLGIARLRAEALWAQRAGS